MLSGHPLCGHVLSSLLTASVVLALAGPVCSQSPICGGLRMVEDPISEAPYLACTDLRGANLTRADGERTDLRGADLRWANLTQADLGRADLRGADLRWANLDRADLSLVLLIDANLATTILTGAVLSGADLTGALLSGADLTGADLGTDGEWATDLSGADLTGANLAGANLSMARGLDTATLTGAFYNSATQFPPDLDPAEAGMNYVEEE